VSGTTGSSSHRWHPSRPHFLAYPQVSAFHSGPSTLGKRAYGESPYRCYLMTRCIERAMALLRRGDRSVTEACFAVGCGSLGSFSSRFSELVGVPPSTYRRQAARATAGMPWWVAKQVTRPVRNREAPPPEPHLD
jgi:hypothetical protein